MISSPDPAGLPQSVQPGTPPTDGGERKEPSRPRIVVRIGVTGHRHLSSEAQTALRRVAAAVLLSSHTAAEEFRQGGHVFPWFLPYYDDPRAVADELRQGGHGGYRDELPSVRLITQLAGGSDTITAEMAIKLKGQAPEVFDLQAVLPYPAKDYEEDFHRKREDNSNEPDPEAIARFQRLLHEASRVFSLPAIDLSSSEEWRKADQKGRKKLLLDARLINYEAAGRVVLQQSDLLLVVLDPGRPGARGGTAQMDVEARAAEIPSIWLDPAKPDHVVLRRPGVTEEGGIRLAIPAQDAPGPCYPEVSEAVTDLLRLPDSSPSDSSGHNHQGAATGITDFFGQRPPGWVERLLYRLPWEVLKGLSLPFRPRKLPAAARPPEPEIPAGNDTRALYQSNYRHTHQLAINYAILYRGSFLWNYVLGATAVTTALLAYADGGHELLWSVVELALIVLLVLNYRFSRAGHWQQRSVDYRFLAEHFRQMRFLHLLGLAPSDFRHPVYRISGDPRRSWMHWYFRAIVRMVGLPQVKADSAYLAEARQVLRERWAASQLDYHRGNQQSLEATVRLLSGLMKVSFALAFLACLLHVVADLVPDLHLHNLSPWFTLFAASAPSWGAACHAIEVQGEFERLTVRSHEVQVSLEELVARLDGLGSSPTFPSLFALTSDMAKAMLADVIDWRIVYQLRPPKPI
jgi:hypothetical protein